MANIEKLTRKVLHGLECCGIEPETRDDCGDCPYLDGEDDFCISRLCRDARQVIITLDTTINAMLGNFGDSCDVEACDRKDGGT